MKKNIKLILALVLVALLAMTSALADTYSLKINLNPADKGTHTYTAYQLFIGDLDEATTTQSQTTDGYDLTNTKDKRVLSNVDWGSAFNSTNKATFISALKGDDTISTTGSKIAALTAESSARDVVEAMAECNTAAKATALADAIGGWISSAEANAGQKTGIKYTTGETNVHDVTFEGLASGYYFVTDQVTDGADDSAVSKFMLQVLSNVEVTAKTSIPTIEKKVKENDHDITYTTDDSANLIGAKYNDVADYEINDTVPFELIGTLPSNFDEYVVYQYCFTDTLSAGLSYQGDAKAYVVPSGTANLDEFIASVDTADSDSYLKSYLINSAMVTTAEADTKSESSTLVFYPSATSGTYKDAAGQDVTVQHDLKKITVKNSDGTTRGLTASDKIVLRYTAKINAGAVMGDATGNVNEAKITYSNNPNKGGEGDTEETTPDKVIVFVYQLDDTKVDAATYQSNYNKKYYQVLTGADDVPETEPTAAEIATAEQGKNDEELAAAATAAAAYAKEHATKLKDAEFVLKKYVKDGVTVAAGTQGATEYFATIDANTKLTGWVTSLASATVLKSDDDGKFNVDGLDDGTYYLKETKPPKGYNLLNSEIKIEITATTVNGQTWNGTSTDALTALTITIDNHEPVAGDQATGLVETVIANESGATLPSTGGIGTTLFYVGGSILVLLAVVLLVTKRRMGSND